MDMQVNSTLIKAEREKRAWSQEHLAKLAGLGLRTIQRIESTGAGSYESVSAIAAVFGVPVADLRVPAESRQRELSRGKIAAQLAARRLWAWLGLAFLVQLVTPPQMTIWIVISKVALTLLLWLGYEFAILMARLAARRSAAGYG